MSFVFQQKIIRAAFWLAPCLMLVSDLLSWTAVPGTFWIASIAFWLSFYFFLILILGLIQLAGRTKFSMLAGMVAGFGALIGITIIGMSRFAWGMEIQGVAETRILAAHADPAVFFSSRFPGITFPIGLILLILAVRRSLQMSWLITALGVLSILLFPAGRIPGQPLINTIGDALMVLFFATLVQRFGKGKNPE